MVRMNEDHEIQRHVHQFSGTQATGWLRLGKYDMKYHYTLAFGARVSPFPWHLVLTTVIKQATGVDGLSSGTVYILL